MATSVKMKELGKKCRTFTDILQVQVWLGIHMRIYGWKKRNKKIQAAQFFYVNRITWRQFLRPLFVRQSAARHEPQYP
jgi:hypothetical protein